MKSLLIQFLRVNIWRTIAVNFFYLKWKDAIKLPIVLCRGARFNGRGGVEFGCPVKFGLFRIGSRSTRIVDSRYERTIVYNEGKIIINGNTWLGVGCRLNVYKKGILTIGSNLKVTGRTTIICCKSIIIGSDGLFSWDIQIMDTDFHRVLDKEDNQTNYDKEIVIGEHVWIGARCTILKGSYIPANSVVAAGSLFSGRKDEEKCIYAGQGKNLRAVKDSIKWVDM